MTNEETQDMTGTGKFIKLPEMKVKPFLDLPETKDDPEPERYWDWMMWKMRQEEKEEGNE